MLIVYVDRETWFPIEDVSIVNITDDEDIRKMPEIGIIPFDLVGKYTQITGTKLTELLTS